MLNSVNKRSGHRVNWALQTCCMKKIVSLLVILALVCQLPAQQNLLSGKYTKDELTTTLIPQSKWTPFPRLNDRTAWSKADQEMMKAFLKAAEPNINYVWPYI